METILRTFLYQRSVPVQAIAYASAGGIGTTVHYAALAVLLNGAAIDLIAASTIGAILGGLVNYWLAHRKVFDSRVPHHLALPRFAVVATGGIAINAAVLSVCATVFGAIGAQFLASSAVLASGFLFNRMWSFRE